MEEVNWLDPAALHAALNSACRNTEHMIVFEIEQTGKIPSRFADSPIYQHIHALSSQLKALQGVPGYTLRQPNKAGDKWR